VQLTETVTDKQAKRVGAVQPGQEKAPGWPYSSLPVPEGGLQEGGRIERDFLQGCVVIGQGGMALS